MKSKLQCPNGRDKVVSNFEFRYWSVLWLGASSLLSDAHQGKNPAKPKRRVGSSMQGKGKNPWFSEGDENIKHDTVQETNHHTDPNAQGHPRIVRSSRQKECRSVPWWHSKADRKAWSRGRPNIAWHRSRRPGSFECKSEAPHSSFHLNLMRSFGRSQSSAMGKSICSKGVVWTEPLLSKVLLLLGESPLFINPPCFNCIDPLNTSKLIVKFIEGESF